MFNLTPPAKNALQIAALCSTAYLAVYLARNILGAVSPQMIEFGLFTEEQLGSLSSIFFIAYAIGQLINGLIGNRIKAKYMISIGLVIAGIANALFAAFSGEQTASAIVYGVTGFALAMIYAPMTKLVSENTDPKYTHRCSLGYTFASFFGSPVAGLLAAAFAWKGVFGISSGVLVLMGILCFLRFTAMERTGLITYGTYDKPKGSGGSLAVLLRHRIIRFTLVAMITGVVRTTVVFWLPTFIAQYLGFSPKEAALLYTVSTLAICAAAFIAIFLYERLGHNIDRALLLFFSCSCACFLLVYLIRVRYLCIALLVLAIMSSNCSATLLWSVYCPSLRDTGMVSGATGFLDFSSYIAAAVSSSLFSNAVNEIGWGPLILVWCGLMACGILVALPGRKPTAV